VARLAGSAARPSYTTGPATRSALAAAGALGATTGTVVHLAQPPSTHVSTIGVLAHELAHARHPVSRPRFLLRAPSGGLDAEERSARTVGDRVQLVARAGLLDDLGSAASDRLGAIGGQVAGDAPRALGERLGGMTGGDGAAGEVLAGRPGWAGLPGAAGLPGLAGLTGLAGAAGEGAAGGAGEVAAGIVNGLPVGGAAAVAGVADVAAQAARSAVADSVRETVTGVLRQAAQGAPDTGLGSAAGAGQLGGYAQGVAANLANAAATVGATSGQLATGAADIGQAVSGLAGVGQTAGGLLSTAAGAASNAVQGLTGSDLDRLTEALEERLLRQLERRGGRYAGVF